MAKEIVIQQLSLPDIKIKVSDDEHSVYIEQSERVNFIDAESVRRLISALCELSGVSGDVKRYDPTSDGHGMSRTVGMEEWESGDYVKYEDYARLQAENEELKKELADFRKETGK